MLDVKFGSGAIMDTMEKTLDLAMAMVSIGTMAGRNVTAVVSSMEEPLGTHIGNALEVKEAIDILSGRAGGDLKEVSLFLGAQMLIAGGICQGEERALALLNAALDSGKGLSKLREMIEAQGGDGRVCQDVSLLPGAPVIIPVPAEQGGYLTRMDTAAIGSAAQRMGAGRRVKDDVIDPAVGIVMNKRLGDEVAPGEPLATLHARTEESAQTAAAELRGAITVSDRPPRKPPLLYALVTPEGVRRL